MALACFSSRRMNSREIRQKRLFEVIVEKEGMEFLGLERSADTSGDSWFM